ncbi:MAG: twin-arginine translocase TatA/TatE family subunit [Deltaproteobacteria bacterium]|nr:twin-arginine translocase TatA/TatE family subunit [Deltaproteobacteria bacterium]
MFGIGTSELLIILLIALLVLGPKEIPKIARTLGRGMRELQRAKDELRQTISTEVEEEKETIKPSNLPENKAEEEEVASAENKPSGTDSETNKETVS